MYISNGISALKIGPSNDSPFRPGSSNVDWCEPNYVVTEYIAEFWNSVSNIFFFLVPPLMIVLFGPYSKRVANGVSALWIFLIIIGIGSIYFHATLSFVGQLVDEISILWVLMVAYSIFLPSVFFPGSLRLQRVLYAWGINKRTQHRRFIYGCTVVGILITFLSVVYPYANAFVLMILGLPAIGFMAVHISRSDNRRLKALGIHCLSLWATAVTIWICDRMFCSFWLSISFPYLHSIWHVMILFSSNEAIVVSAYLIIRQQYPNANLVIHYWPSEQCRCFSLPYLKFHDDGTNDYSMGSSASLAEKTVV